MRIVQGQDLFVTTDPLSFQSGLDVSGAPLSQVYDKELKQYEPNRAIVVTKIVPWVDAFDASTNVSYSTRTKTEDDTHKYMPWSENPSFRFRETRNNRVIYTNLTTSQIKNNGDGSYDLMYNVPVGESLTLVCQMKAKDPRTGSTIFDEKELELKTVYMAAHNYKVELDVPKIYIINPIKYGAWKSSTQMGNYTQEHVLPVKVRASLYDGSLILRDRTETIENSNANEQQVDNIRIAYWWQWWDEDTWRNFDAELPWLLTDFDSNGNLPGDIKVNIEAIEKMRIRCFVKAYSTETERPVSPTDTGLFSETTLIRQLPLTSYAKVIVDSGTYIDLVNTAPVKMHVEMFDNSDKIEDPDKYYKIEWYAKKHRYGSTEEVIGSGSSITIDKTKLGITRNEGVQIYPKVWDYGAFVPLSDGTARSPLGYTEPVIVTSAKGEVVMTRRIM